MAYFPNDTSKYSHRSRNVTEILDDYLLERKASKIPVSSSSLMKTMNDYNSHNYNMSMSTNMTNMSSSLHSKCNSSFASAQSQPSVLSKIQGYTREIKGKHHNDRIEELNKKLINNVNVMNIRYKDTDTNNYFITHLNHFKQVDGYNNKAQSIYSNDLYPNKGCWGVNLTAKIYQYRKQFK